MIDLLAVFHYGLIEQRDLVVDDSDDPGLRAAAIRLLQGSCSGVPLRGPPTRMPVKALRASHYELCDGEILRTWPSRAAPTTAAGRSTSP